VREEGKSLHRAGYLQLEKPSERVAVQRFGQVDADLFHAIVNRCVVAGQPCMDETMRNDAHAAMGHGNAKD
jgi:cytochrome o ubiquinol oxidase subunit 2